MNSSMFWIYMLACENGSYYTGYTVDLEKRYSEHMAGTAKSKYTRSFKPLGIAACWKLHDTKGTALKIEHLIKKRNRAEKEELIKEPASLKEIILQELELDCSISEFNPKNLLSKSAAT
ncbi:MAG: GIY-YIG nuclease family protein [bacterium]|nr:GIY-YIG nuclease family protein [bacterium]